MEKLFWTDALPHQGYVLLSQNEVLVERFVRQGEKWVRTEIRDLDESLVLDSIGCAIPLPQIYAGLAIAGGSDG